MIFFVNLSLKSKNNRMKTLKFNLKNISTLALVVAIAGLTFTSCKCDKKVSADANTAGAALTTGAAAAVAGNYDSLTGNFQWDRGADKELTLADGTKMTVGENSTESKLYDRLNGDYVVSDSISSSDWMVMDRVYFETGGNALTAESQEQVKNVAAILKNFPNAAVKLGGYTDNTGSAETNKAVSKARAESVSAQLVTLGIAADKLGAEGYGPEFPICPANDTDECKAQNRRVDIRVSAK